MRAYQKRFHLLYKTTCVITNRFYIGIHSTDDPFDGYLGSGKRLRKSVWKYGRKNHIVEYLDVFKNREDLFNAERNLVNERLLQNPYCMNLALGGIGNVEIKESVLKGKPFSEEHKRNLSEARKGMKFSDEHRANISKAGKGRVISDEQKKKVSEKLKGKPGTNNRPIVVNGKEYPSLDAAALEAGIKRTTIGKRILSKKFRDTYYKDSPKE